jgi:F-type H+-transporting ATPase subunit a
MGPEFIGRVIRTSAWVAPISALYVAVYYDLGFAAAIIAGTAWACANLYLLRMLVRTMVRTGKCNKRDAIIIGCVKFPVLYALGFLALRADGLPLLGLLAGFWLPKGVIVLKYLGMMLNSRLSARGLRGGEGAPAPPGARAGRARGGSFATLFVVMALALWLVPQLAPGGSDVSAAVEVEAAGAQHGHDQSAAESQQAQGQGEGRGQAGEEPTVSDVLEHDEEGLEHGKEEEPELPNLITVIVALLPSGSAIAHFLHEWENLVFSLLSVTILGIVVSAASRRATMVPGLLQNVVEFLVEKLDEFICGILGPHGRRYVPFLGTLFVYILFMNLFGLVPFMKSPTANLNQTLALALCVFFYVQYTGIRNFGIGGYIFHMAGEPRDPISIALVPIMLPLHIIGELAKPLSLSLRLFGNITGEDVLIVIFVTLGIGMLSFMHLPIGVPLQVPFIFLAMLTSTIQALVFMLLSTVYFLMMMPHDEH